MFEPERYQGSLFPFFRSVLLETDNFYVYRENNSGARASFLVYSNDSGDCDRRMSVRIRQVKDEEVPEIRRWLDDPPFRSEFLAFGRDSDSVVSEKLGEVVHGTEEASYLAVERITDSKLIGLLFSHKVHSFHYFEVGFYIIPEERSKGYGAQAMRLLLEHIFETQSVKTIVAGTSSLNIASQKALLKAGFKKVGMLKKTLFRNDCWEDSIIYQVTNDE